jgi:hypothetical protein
MEKSITAPFGVVNILDNYHNYPESEIFYEELDNLLEYYHKYLTFRPESAIMPPLDSKTRQKAFFRRRNVAN